MADTNWVQTTTLNAPGNDLSPEMKTYYAKNLIQNAEPELVHDQFCEKHPIPSGNGKSMEFRRYSTLPKALKPLTEGVTPKGNKLNVSTVTVEVNQFGDWIGVSDVLETTAIDKNLVQATTLLGSQAGRTLDTITREVLCAGTNKMFAPAVNALTGAKTDVFMREDVSTNCKLTPDVVRKAVANLKRMNAKPFDGYFPCIIHPDVTCDITSDPDWTAVHQYAHPEEIYEGEIGRLGGARFIESTEAKIIGPGYIFGNPEDGGTCRMTLHTELNGGGSTDIYPEEEITSAQAAELTQRISDGKTVKIYVGGNECTIQSVKAGTAGTGKFVVDKTVQNVPTGAVICGYGAGKDGSAIYCSLFIGRFAAGTTDVEGLGLQHIIKQMGSAGTADPLNQRATSGWKATKAAVRLIEENMIRVEHSGPSFGASAVSN